MPVTVRKHLRRHARARREHPRGPVVNVKLRRQDAFYVIGTLMGDEANLEERIRNRAKDEDRGLTEDDEMEIREIRAINKRITEKITKATTRRKG